MITCPACGKKIPAGLKYCAYCGAKASARPVQWLRRTRWRLLAFWLGVTALASLAVLAVFALPATGLLPRLAEAENGPDAAFIAAGVLAVAGLLAAAAQWVALRKRGRHMLWWIVAVPAGWALAYYLYSSWPLFIEREPALSVAGQALAPFVLLGGLGALAQWPLARRYAWPQHRWVLGALAAFGLTWLAAVAAPATAGGGWFAGFVLRMRGNTDVATFDVAIAALLGALLGAAQFPTVRRSAPAAVLWPVSMAISAAAAAALLDIGLAVGSEASKLAGGPDAGRIWITMSTLPIGTPLAWLVMGAGLGTGQWVLLRGSALLMPRLAPSISLPGPLPESPSPYWVPLAATGFAAASPVAWLLYTNGWLILGAATAGLLAGVPQWLALRHDFPQAAWFPAANAGGWMLIAIAGQLPGIPAMATPLGLVVLTCVLSLAPGLVLARR